MRVSHNRAIGSVESFHSRDAYASDRLNHGESHVDRYRKGKFIGRYRADGIPILFNSRTPLRLKRSDWNNFQKAVSRLKRADTALVPAIVQEIDRAHMKSWPAIIPPLSRVRLVRVDKELPKTAQARMSTKIGTIYRIGYYSRQDGLETIWLVDPEGEYRETAGWDWIVKHYQLEYLSNETDYYGIDRPKIGPLK